MITLTKGKKILNNFLKNKHFAEVFKGSVLSFGVKIITLFMGFGSTWIISHYYGAGILGYLSLFNSLLAITIIFTVPGLGTSLMRLIPEHLNLHSKYSALQIYKKSLIIIIVLALSFSIVVYFFKHFIALNVLNKIEFEPFLLFLSFLIVIRSVTAINTSSVRSLKKIKLFNIFQFSQSALFFLLLLISTSMFFEKYNPIYIQFITDLILFILAFWMVYKVFIYKVPKGDMKNMSYSNLMQVSFPMFITGTLSAVISQVDILMLSAMKDAEEIGLYTLAFKLATLSSFFLVAVNTLAAPKFSELFSLQKYDDLKHVACQSSKLLFWITLPLTLIFAIFGKTILSFFGEEFIDAYYALLFLLFGQLINALSGSVGLFLNMTGREKQFAKTTLVIAVINIIFNLVLIPKYGLDGAAFASMISLILWNVIGNIIIKREYGFSIYYLPFLTRKTI
jgi:O-antigen/teichoic acid export membrane protein